MKYDRMKSYLIIVFFSYYLSCYFKIYNIFKLFSILFSIFNDKIKFLKKDLKYFQNYVFFISLCIFFYLFFMNKMNTFQFLESRINI